jgi:phage terminase Nu1 subunit (DNA packaging protein)
MGTQHRTVCLVQAFPDPFQQQHEASKLAGKKVSQSECAIVFGIHRNTLGSWLKQGCPYVKKANKALGINWILDTAAVAQWREEQAIKNTVGDLTALGEDELKRRKLQAETSILEIDAAKKRGEVAPIDDMERAWQNISIAISTRMLLVPGRCSMHLLMIDNETVIKNLIEEEIRQGLTEAADIDLDEDS